MVHRLFSVFLLLFTKHCQPIASKAVSLDEERWNFNDW